MDEPDSLSTVAQRLYDAIAQRLDAYNQQPTHDEGLEAIPLPQNSSQGLTSPLYYHRRGKKHISSLDTVSIPKTSEAYSGEMQPFAENPKKSHKSFTDQLEKRILVCSTIGLSILGVIAFLVTGQVTVVVAMNTPLLTIIGKEFFTK